VSWSQSRHIKARQGKVSLWSIKNPLETFPMSYYATEEVDRAVGLYFRRAEREGGRVDQPNRNLCDRIGNTIYIRNVNGVLARCRVTTGGRLKMVATG
jgi:hypothetical protein